MATPSSTVNALTGGRSDLAGDAPASRRESPAADARRRGGWLVYAVLTLLLGASWKVSRAGLFEPGDDVGYWIGVVGGVMMLILLVYPLRKYVKFMQGWGKVKFWLWGHMMLGIGGPLLILIHCTFRTGSTNAAVALWSMVVVAASGVIGRFIYTRLNRGLLAEQSALRQFRAEARFDGLGGRSRLWFAPEAQRRLQDFEEGALSAASGPGGHWLRLLFVLPIESWQVRLAAQGDIAQELRRIGQERQWDRAEFLRHRRMAKRTVVAHLAAVMRVALYAAWERLFALWHVAHVPFVFILVVSGVFHVIAVHAY